MKTFCLLVATIAVILPVSLAGRFPIFHTTFRPFDFSDVQPTKVEEVKAQGWTLINAECNADPAKSSFAGYRWLQPYVTVEGKKQSNFVQLYDADGHVAGTQSIVPVEKFMWDCTYNDYYVKENITLDDGYVREFCVSTMYFRDPSTLCTKMEDDEVENALFIQKKDSFAPDSLVPMPKTFLQAEQNQDFWAIDRYIPRMGHHITPNLHDSEDCKSYLPLQVLYAHVDGHCHNSGFVWSHWGAVVNDEDAVRPHGSQWEVTNEWVVKTILTKPSQCELDYGAKHLIRTQHHWLLDSVTYCYTE